MWGGGNLVWSTDSSSLDGSYGALLFSTLFQPIVLGHHAPKSDVICQPVLGAAHRDLAHG